MKPTLQMLRPANETPPKDAVRELRPRSADTIQALAQRKAAVERALAQTREQQQSGEITGVIDQRLREFANASIGKPADGLPGAVVVRVVGLVDGDRDGDEDPPGGPPKARTRITRLPLPGLHVEISFREVAVATATTDLAGLALLQLPEGTKGLFSLNVLGSDGQVAASHRGRKTDTNQPALLLETTVTRALAPAVEKGSVWIDAAEKARLHGAALQAKVTSALVRQEALLVASLARIDAAIIASQ